MDVTNALLDSWDRQCKILDSVASLVNDSNRKVKPSEDGWPLDFQLAHVHGTRKYWLSQYSPKHAEGLPSTLIDWDTAIEDLDAIKAALKQSSAAIRAAVQEGIANGNGPSGGYDNPVMFLQHMLWHEGWHTGLLFLGLRLAGQEPKEEWEEANVWGLWRVELY